jgi:hypothetical protein
MQPRCINLQLAFGWLRTIFQWFNSRAAQAPAKLSGEDQPST